MKTPFRLRRHLFLGLGVWAFAAVAQGQEAEPFEDPPINYSATKPNDRATKLNEAFQKQADGNYPTEITCECGAVVRGFANLDKIRK